MEIRHILLIAGAILPLLGCIVYAGSILRGNSKPQRTTRLLLTLITGLSFFALLAAGDTSGIWLALASFVEAAFVYGLSLKFGMGGRDKLDVICFALCGVGLLVWLSTGQSLVGLAAAIIADFIAIVPAFVKTWRLPHTESWLFYALGCAAAILILAAGPYNPASLAFPLYILFANAIFVWAILRPHPDTIT